jgi:hypothetical protein
MSEKAGFGILIHIQSLQHFQITYPSFHRWWWYFGFHSLNQNIRHIFSCGAEINTKDDEYKICKEIRTHNLNILSSVYLYFLHKCFLPYSSFTYLLARLARSMLFFFQFCCVLLCAQENHTQSSK